MAVAGIEASLVSIHSMLAAFTKTPELELEKAEAATLAHAIAEVNRHYQLPAASPGHVAIASLIGAAFVVYRGKIVRIQARKAGRAPADPPSVGGTPDEAVRRAQDATPQAGAWFPPFTTVATETVN